MQLVSCYPCVLDTPPILSFLIQPIIMWTVDNKQLTSGRVPPVSPRIRAAVLLVKRALCTGMKQVWVQIGYLFGRLGVSVSRVLVYVLGSQDKERTPFRLISMYVAISSVGVQYWHKYVRTLSETGQAGKFPLIPALYSSLTCSCNV